MTDVVVPGPDSDGGGGPVDSPEVSDVVDDASVVEAADDFSAATDPSTGEAESSGWDDGDDFSVATDPSTSEAQSSEWGDDNSFSVATDPSTGEVQSSEWDDDDDLSAAAQSSGWDDGDDFSAATDPSVGDTESSQWDDDDDFKAAAQSSRWDDDDSSPTADPSDAGGSELAASLTEAGTPAQLAGAPEDQLQSVQQPAGNGHLEQAARNRGDPSGPDRGIPGEEVAAADRTSGEGRSDRVAEPGDSVEVKPAEADLAVDRRAADVVARLGSMIVPFAVLLAHRTDAAAEAWPGSGDAAGGHSGQPEGAADRQPPESDVVALIGGVRETTPEGAMKYSHGEVTLQRAPDGTTSATRADVTVTVQSQGAVVVKGSSAQVTQGSGGTTVVTTQDGATITADPEEGKLVVETPDFRVYTVERDGTTSVSQEETTVVTAPDGSYRVERSQPDGSLRVQHSNGSKEIVTEDTRLVQDPEGRTRTIYPDGASQVLRYADGSTFPGAVQWPEPGPLRPHGPPVNGATTYTDQAGRHWVISSNGHEAIYTDTGLWEKDPEGNMTIWNWNTRETFYQGVDGSRKHTDANGNVLAKTDPDGKRWDRDGSGNLVYAGRPHLEWTSPDGKVTVKEINGNYFRTSPQGHEIILGADGKWQKVSEDAFHSTVANSRHIQHIRETPNHPGQKGLAATDALLGNFQAATEFGAQVMMSAAEWGALGPWGLAAATVAGLLEARSATEAGLVLADAFMPGPSVAKHVPTGKGHVPTGGPHPDVPTARVDQPGPTTPDGVAPHDAQPKAGAGGPSGGDDPSHPSGSSGPTSADVWAKREDIRGREIQDELARTEYQNYLQTDDLVKGKNFPAIDFVSRDGTHGVSVKSVNPYSKAFRDGNVLHGGGTEKSQMGLLGHADELVERALVEKAGSHVTLDIRVPPGTPPAAVDFLRDTILDHVDDPHGRLQVIVRPFP